MLIKKIIINGCVTLFFAGSCSAFAQYGTGDSSLGQFLSEDPDLKQVEEKHVDVPYSRGRSIFRGAGDAPKLSYCVMHKGKSTKVKRSSMYPFKHSSYTELANKLFNCDKPGSKITTDVDMNDLIYVLYYLDVEYELSLEKA